MTERAMVDDLQYARSELADIAVYASQLDQDQLASPSLCSEWRIDDILSHLAWTATASIPTLAATMWRGRLHPGRAMASAFGRAAIEHRRDTPVEQVIRMLRDVGTGQRPFGPAVRFGRPREFLVDYIVHHVDIRRPVHQSRRIPEDRLIAALEAAPKIGGLIGSRRRIRGLRLEATDIDWTHGDGPVVRGPGEALLLAATGRAIALAELTGDGVPLLSSRAQA
jgi:uncharacterized protein (TIGR03083 family)